MDQNLIKTEVVNTLNSDEAKGYVYYVYALCKKENEKLIPFYIGKGKGDRVWAHEEGEAKEMAYLEKNCESKEEFEHEKELVSRKHKAINEIISSGQKVEKIIIKSGMTSEEAFMAEGALINLFSMNGLSFSVENELTNEQSGHSSKGEDEQKIDSRAMSVEDFYNEYGKEPVNVETLKEKIMLRNINTTYNPCKECAEKTGQPLNELIKDAVRGFWWRLGDPNKMDYLFALYQGRIVGVYKVNNRNPDGSIIQAFNTILDVERSDYPNNPYLVFRKKDFEMASIIKNDIVRRNIDVKKYKYDIYYQLSQECQTAYNDFDKDNKTNEPAKSLLNWIQRRYYVLSDITEEDKNYEHFQDLLGRRVVEYTTDSKTQNEIEKPLTFNQNGCIYLPK